MDLLWVDLSVVQRGHGPLANGKIVMSRLDTLNFSIVLKFSTLKWDTKV